MKDHFIETNSGSFVDATKVNSFQCIKNAGFQEERRQLWIKGKHLNVFEGQYDSQKECVDRIKHILLHSS